MYAFAKPADFELPREKVLRLAEQQVRGVTSLGRQLVNSVALEIVIYLCTCLRTCSFIAAPSLHAQSALVLDEQTRLQPDLF